MEKELKTGQTREERILHKTFGLRDFTLLEEVRQGPAFERVGNPLAVECLLGHAADHLRHVDVRPLTAANVHLQGHVVLRHCAFDGFADLVAHAGQRAVQLGFQRLLQVTACLQVERVVLELRDERLALLVLQAQHFCFGLDHHVSGGDVPDADREAHVAHEPAREPRHPIHGPHAGLETVVAHQREDDALLRPVAQTGFAHAATDHHRVFDVQLAVERVEPLEVRALVVQLVFETHVDQHLRTAVGFEQQVHQLLAGLQFDRVDDARHGQFDPLVGVAAPAGHAHHLVARQEHVLVRALLARHQEVLHARDDWVAIFGADERPTHEGQGLRLRFGFLSLRNVYVHLVAVKVCVVGLADTAVEAQGLEGQHAHFVRHDGLPVQRGLAVEQRDVAVVQVAFDHIAVAQVLGYFLAVVREQIDAAFIIPRYNCVCTRVVLGTSEDQFSHFRVV